MIKEFSYNVVAVVVNNLTGIQDNILQQHTASVSIANTSTFVDYPIVDDNPIIYVHDALMQYLFDNQVTVTDLDLMYFQITSNDPEVSVYFESKNSVRIDIYKSLHDYMAVPDEFPVATPTGFTGEALSETILRWSWEAVSGCSYIIKDFLGEVIATVGIGITTFVEEQLTPGTNYTRRIQAFDGIEYSQSSGYVTATTQPIVLRPHLTLFEVATEKTVEPIEVDTTPPSTSSLFKSGIGDNEDVKCSIYNIGKEVFTPNLTITTHNKEEVSVYNEKVFQYRQKSTSKINKTAEYGKFDYEIYSHFREAYDFTVSANVYAPLDEDRVLNINLDTSGDGIGIINKEFRYRVNGVIYNKPINLKKRFTFKLNVAYDTSFSFQYRVKYTDPNTLDVSYSDYYIYNDLKSYEVLTVLNNINKIEDLIEGNRDRADLSVEVDAPNKNIISVGVNFEGYIYATNNLPDSYNTNYVINSFIYTETNRNGKEILSIAGLTNGSYLPMNGTITYNGSNYGDFVYTIKDISLPGITLKWNNTVELDRIGPDTITALSGRYLGTYSFEDTFNDYIPTSIHDSISSKILGLDISSLQLKCDVQPTGNSSEIVDDEDLLYTESMVGSVFTLTNLFGDVDIKWNDSGTTTSTYTDNVKVTTNSTIVTYSKSYVITRTIPKGKSGTIVLMTMDELERYKPYAGGLEWPYETSKIRYRLGDDKLGILIHFEDNQKISTGLKTVVGSIQTENVLFSKVMQFTNSIYDYECETTPKVIVNKYSIVPQLVGGTTIYPGANDDPNDMSNVVYQIINNNPRMELATTLSGDITLNITTPRPKRFVESNSIWVKGIPTVIELDKSGINARSNFSIKKTGGHPNTVAKWSDFSDKLSTIGDTIYSTEGKLYLYANKENIVLENTEYTQWSVGVLNKDNVIDTLDIAMQDISPLDCWDIVETLEIAPVSNDIAYRVENRMFVIYNTLQGESNITYSEVIETIESGETDEFILYNDSVIREIPIEIANPARLYDDKTFILRLDSDNPNIELSLSNKDFDINNPDLQTYPTTLTILVDARILIQSQTPWRLKLNPGYLYLSAKEYYMYGKYSDIVTTISENVYGLLHPANNRSPIIVNDDNGVLFREIPSNIELNETTDLINKKYIYASYSDIDPMSVLINGSIIAHLTVIDNIIILPSNLNDSSINIRYKVNNSFCVDWDSSSPIVTVHGGSNHNVYYETSTQNILEDIDINPLRSSVTNGFLYIKE